jgi:hypothetical protein
MRMRLSLNSAASGAVELIVAPTLPKLLCFVAIIAATWVAFPRRAR